MTALQRTDNRILFRENLKDISPFSNADPFNINIVQYNAGNRIDLTDTPFVDDLIRRSLDPATFFQITETEKEKEELAAKTFKFYLDGGEIATMQRIIDGNSHADANLRQISTQNEARRERQHAEIIRQREVAEYQARTQAAASRTANEPRNSAGSASPSLSKTFNDGARYVGERLEDTREFVTDTASKAVNLASDFGDAALDTGKTAVRMGGNVLNSAAEAISDVASDAGNAVSGALNSGRNLIAKYSPFGG